MSKTPIMVLQESAIKNGFIPVYEEIASINGTHNNKFVIRVTCKSITADGVSTRKKQAKQNAAREMLTLLTESGEFPKSIVASLPAVDSANSSTDNTKLEVVCARLNNSLTDSPVSSLSPNSLPRSPASETQSAEAFVNYVGRLNELCVAKHLPDPQYEIINVSGVSHTPVFTMSCTVGFIQMEATASSKKKVKHDLAKKLLKQICGEISSDAPTQNCTTNCSDSAQEGILANLGVQFKSLQIDDTPNHLDDAVKEKILCIYKKRTVQHVCDQHNVPVFQYHTLLTELLQETSLKLTSLENPVISNMQILKSEISMAFRKPLTEIEFSIDSRDYMIGFRLNTIPTVLQVGIGKTREEAQEKALLKLNDLIIQFRK